MSADTLYSVRKFSFCKIYTVFVGNKCKKQQFKTVFNGDTAYITQLKQQKSKGAITFAARRHNVNVLLRNSTFLIFAVLVV